MYSKKPSNRSNLKSHSPNVEAESKEAAISFIISLLEKNSNFFVEYKNNPECKKYFEEKKLLKWFLKLELLILNQGIALQRALRELFENGDSNELSHYLYEDKNREFLVKLGPLLKIINLAVEQWDKHNKDTLVLEIEKRTQEEYESEKFAEKYNAVHRSEKERIFKEKQWLNKLENILKMYTLNFPHYYQDKNTVIPAELINNNFLCERIFNLYITSKINRPMVSLQESNLDEILFIINNPSEFLLDNHLKVDPISLIASSKKDVVQEHSNQPPADLHRAIPQQKNEVIIETIDLLLQGLKDIGRSKKNIFHKKAEALNLVAQLLPKIKSNKSLIKIAELIEKKDSDYAYLRQERDFWRFHTHANTKTWANILGQIKQQMDRNVQGCKSEVYSRKEYGRFLTVMNEHRSRGFGSVTHSKIYKQFDELLEGQDDISISAKIMRN